MSDEMGCLYVIPTPIGNLGDFSLRAVELLREVDLILAEDTRVSGKLLQHYQISKPLRSYHTHNEHRSVQLIVDEIAGGLDIALISDAGTPGISDPGYLLVRRCVDIGIVVQCLPGATAFVPALVISGLPSNRFHFEGFLPHKKGRKSRLSYLSSLPDTFIIYESPHRIKRCIVELITYCGPERESCLCRELTKMHEEVVRGSLAELQQWLSTRTKIRGEIVLVVAGTGS